MRDETPTDPIALCLSALAATLGDPRRAQRFLDLTGIGTDMLRKEADSPAVLIALIQFLEAHEPDLLSVCDDLGVRAETLVAARRTLQQEGRR